jgi:hypothetical protein
MRPALSLAMVMVAAFVGCTTVLGLDDLEYRDDAAQPDAGLPPGSVIWSRQIGGPGDDRASGVAVDPSGDAVVSGCLGGADAGMPGCVEQADVFASRYSPEGELRWSKTFGDPANQFAEDLAGGPSGAVIAGYFRGNFGFGGPLLVNGGGDDLFFAKLGPTGDHVWSARYGTGNIERAFRVATDADENVILTGGFEGTLDFGGEPLSGINPLNPFLARFDASGGLLWSKTFPASGQAYASGVACDASGNVLLTGLFSNAVDFGKGAIAGPVLDKNAFVATFLPNGDLRWARPLSGDGFENGVGVGADGDGDVVAVGFFDDTVDLGQGSFTSAGSDDIFVGKYSRATGEPIWARTFGGPGDDRPHDVLVDAAGNVVITGEFVDSVDFQGTTLTSAGGRDAFLVTLGPDGDVLRARQFGNVVDDIGYRLAFGPGGEIFLAGSFAGTIQFGDKFFPSFGGSDGFLVKFAP